MKKGLRYILLASSMLSIIIFSISATVNYAESNNFIQQAFSEPVNMLLVGFGLIGLSSFLKRHPFVRPLQANFKSHFQAFYKNTHTK